MEKLGLWSWRPCRFLHPCTTWSCGLHFNGAFLGIHLCNCLCTKTCHVHHNFDILVLLFGWLLLFKFWHALPKLLVGVVRPGDDLCGSSWSCRTKDRHRWFRKLALNAIKHWRLAPKGISGLQRTAGHGFPKAWDLWEPWVEMTLDSPKFTTNGKCNTVGNMIPNSPHQRPKTKVWEQYDCNAGTLAIDGITAYWCFDWLHQRPKTKEHHSEYRKQRND